ncbi:guanyl-nucleotide exchange factor [Lithospermum erythrorhizon]|uniref:Guanyl-nucleotide exchange factor n=1 Tax=Lithospermum erythrorhizon TaxID=34254 RepID=A0AAV3RHW8_LITER
MVTYYGLESCMQDSHSYDNDSGTSREDICPTDSFCDDASSCSSSNNVFGSVSSHYTPLKRDNGGNYECDSSSPQHLFEKPKPAYESHSCDIDTMKEKFSKLLLGEDTTGGAKGVSTALALSNAITSLAVSVFGELWKLEPLSEERKGKWKREINWLLSPTAYMVELVPAKKNCSSGRTMEIMTPKVRSDVNMNLPALQKLDSMLIETMGSMVNTEFWYAEVGSRAEGRSLSEGESKRWWLPYPRVPTAGLSDAERTKLVNQGKLVHQVFKAAKAINENILLEMSIPSMISDALPKSGKASLGEELYRVLSSDTSTTMNMVDLLNLKSAHSALQTTNKLEAAIFAWKERITNQTPVRTSWSFMKDPISELDKIEVLVQRAEVLLQQLKSRYPNLPRTFFEALKVQNGKDLGHSIMEAYSRVLANLAYSILSRIGDILQEDFLSNPNSPAAICQLPGLKIPGITDSPRLDHVGHSLIAQMNKVDG